jgi:hypothetical protein
MTKRKEPQVTFWNCTPAMADVISGAIPRPRALPKRRDPLPLIRKSLAWQRINEMLGQYAVRVVVARGETPTFHASQVTELRSMMDADSAVILIGQRWLAAFNEDATRMAVSPVQANSKERSGELAAFAKKTIKNVDVGGWVDINHYARQMADATGCGIDAAKRHVAKAVRLKRGEIVAAGWGGSREGAGRPASNGVQP